MIEIKKSHLLVMSAAFTNIGSGLFLLSFTTTEILLRAISLVFGIIVGRGAVFIEDLMEQIYD